MFMVKRCSGLNLFLKELESFVGELWIIEAEDLKSVLFAVLSRAELDLG